jgi:hypothetical protein
VEAGKVISIRLAEPPSPAALDVWSTQRLPILTKRRISTAVSSVFSIDEEIEINSKTNKVI